MHYHLKKPYHSLCRRFRMSAFCLLHAARRLRVRAAFLADLTLWPVGVLILSAEHGERRKHATSPSLRVTRDSNEKR
jgi:hypothetical protein